MDFRVELAQHAAERSARLTHRQMARGLRGLATIAATAPLLGFLINVRGMENSFQGTAGPKSAIAAAVSANMSESLIPAVYGLGLAIVAWWGFTYLSAQSAQFEIEMLDAIGDLSYALSRHVAARVPRR